MNNRHFKYLALLFVFTCCWISLLAPTRANADEFMEQMKQQISQKQRELYSDFSELVLMVYCNEEYRQIRENLRSAGRADSSLTPDTFRESNDLRLNEILANCSQLATVTSLDARFIQYMTEMNCSIVNYINTVQSNPTFGATLDDRNAYVSSFLAMVFESDFQAMKIFDSLLATPVQAPAAPTQTEVAVSAPIPQKTMRCTKDGRKIHGLVSFTCECGGTFCTDHHLPEAHGCSVDHSKMRVLEKQLRDGMTIDDKLRDRI